MSVKQDLRLRRAEQPSGQEVVVRNVDREIYQRFCERAATLGVPAQSVLKEIVDRGMAEWVRMRSA